MRLQGRGIRSLTVSANSHSGSRKSLLLASPEYEGVTESWFYPELWGARAKPVSTGGRGGAWFIEAEPSDMVLRHYRRGGLMAQLAEKAYLFTGFDSTRSIEEFRLLRQLAAMDLPVPDAVAAIAWKYRLFWYRAAILVKRIPGAVTFPDCERVNDTVLWQELGRVIRRFHDAGLNHVDLNCDNILVAKGQIYLIDFDRCELRANAPAAASWKIANLNRLRRSVEKRCQSLDSRARERVWRALQDGYQR